MPSFLFNYQSPLFFSTNQRKKSFLLFSFNLKFEISQRFFQFEQKQLRIKTQKLKNNLYLKKQLNFTYFKQIKLNSKIVSIKSDQNIN